MHTLGSPEYCPVTGSYPACILCWKSDGVPMSSFFNRRRIDITNDGFCESMQLNAQLKPPNTIENWTSHGKPSNPMSHRRK